MKEQTKRWTRVSISVVDGISRIQLQLLQQQQQHQLLRQCTRLKCKENNCKTCVCDWSSASTTNRLNPIKRHWRITLVLNEPLLRQLPLAPATTESTKYQTSKDVKVQHGWWRLLDGHQEKKEKKEKRNLPQVTCLITERVKRKEKREKGRNNNRHSFEWIPVVVQDEEGEEKRRWAFKEP